MWGARLGRADTVVPPAYEVRPRTTASGRRTGGVRSRAGTRRKPLSQRHNDVEQGRFAQADGILADALRFSEELGDRADRRPL
jgi:hypothetical protein